jgi:alpha-tubulin suppressor-like RCC1 family protein
MPFTFSGLNFVGDVSAQAVFPPPPPPPTVYLWSWGQGSSGQHGLGNTTSVSSPTQIGALSTWTTIDAGWRHGMAVKTDGTLWTWGENYTGRLGLGNTAHRSSPVQVGAETTWSRVAAGYEHSLAIKTDGTLWSWGENYPGGKLGLGDTTNQSNPVQVGALTTWSSIAAGGFGHSLAIKTDGTLWSWGQNNNGQLGLGNTTNRSSPVQVGALTTWSSIAGGGNSISISLKTDGTMWVWGRNYVGKLGLGDTTDRSSPVQIGALTTWLTVAAGYDHNLAVKTDGTMWGWGFNSAGMLGLGNTTSYSSPVQVGAGTTWSSVDAGEYHSMAIKTDGTLWSWGYGLLGQLGDGTNVSKSSPVQIGALTNWSKISGGGNWSMAIG